MRTMTGPTVTVWLRQSIFVVLCAGLSVTGCGSSSGTTGTKGGNGVSNGSSGGGASSSSGMSSGVGASSGSSSGSTSSSGIGSSSGSASGSGSGSASGSGSSSSSGGSSGNGSSGGTPDAGTHAGNPKGSCSAGVPALGQAASTSSPTTVIGTGTAASCTFTAFQSAVASGGVITFNCGSAPATVQVTSTLKLRTDKDTVIDGGNLITLDGGGAVQILNFNSANWQNNETRVTLQNITMTRGKTTPMQAIPMAPAPCSQGYDDGEGGALYMRDGNLTVVNSIFTNNQAAQVGPDTGGGAMYVTGSKHGVIIVDSTFTNNSASNGGAVGCLFAELDVYNSLFTGNHATGHDANNADMSKCSVMNNGQYEIGSGGNGGALYSDGNSVNVLLCGDDIEGNAAGTNAFGGGLFFTSNNFGGTLTITDTTMTGNTGGHWTNAQTGSITNAGTAVGTNCKSIAITNSTVQGYP
jgi:hypothetical protein